MVGNLGKSKLAGRKAVKNCSNSKCRQSTWKIPISSSVQGSWSGFCSGSQVEDRCQDEIFSRLSEKSLGSENASQTHHFSKFGFYTPVHRTDSTSTAVIATAVWVKFQLISSRNTRVKEEDAQCWYSFTTYGHEIQGPPLRVFLTPSLIKKVGRVLGKPFVQTNFCFR